MASIADAFKILLSHDPTHWEEKIRYHPTTIHLTLAGHTHGAQFGVETDRLRWSPVQYRYLDWAGLANEKNRYLYVNRGFGFLAFSGRLGIWPEITVYHAQKDGISHQTWMTAMPASSRNIQAAAGASVITVPINCKPANCQ